MIRLKKATGTSPSDLLDCCHRINHVSTNTFLSRLYLDQLELSSSHLDSLLEDTSSTLATLSELSESFKTVDDQTSAFQKQCEGILSQQAQLTTLANGLEDNLQYYKYLEPITRRLNAPNAGNLVRSQEFSEMLSHLDDCIAYMEDHPDHKEAETYRSRYKLLLTRALTLVRVHFTNAAREIAAEVSKRIADKQLNDTTMSTLLYAKFRVGAPELKKVGYEIEKRTATIEGESGKDSEYQNLLNELHTSFAATRGRLMIPLVRKKIYDIAQAPSTSKNLVAFARSSISYIRGVCLDEYELWREWFHGEGGLYDLLESVCEPLYDHLRPRTIHENDLPRLCELCTLLQTRYLQDPEDEVDPQEANQLDFSSLIQPALEDAQTRLVFRTLAILRDEIERFKPSSKDIDYPARNRRESIAGIKSTTPVLQGRRESVAEPLTLGTQVANAHDQSIDEKGGDLGVGVEAMFEGWYPTLRKAVWLLSRIYRLINSHVFDDLAHQIVHQTTLSLHQAATQITSKSSANDGQLFLIKHLLTLKQQIVAFDIEFVTPDVEFDFSGVTNTFWELRERGGLFNPRTLLRFVGGGGLLPRVVENMLDAKAELDGRLRTVINDFTNNNAKRMTSKLSSNLTNQKKGSDAGEAVQAVRLAVDKEVPLLRQKLDEYLDDARTRETLVAAVQDSVIQMYEDFYEAYTSKANNAGKTVSKKGKGREDDVWDVDTFAEWVENVFRVGRTAVRSSDDEYASSSRSISRSGST